MTAGELDGVQKYRHEYKYRLSTAQIEMLKNRLRHLTPPDPHAGTSGTYRIRSLYFDDYEDRCVNENASGTDPREKYRIRIYNGDASFISLECKRKEREKVQKTSCRITRAQCEQLMQGHVPAFTAQSPVLQKLTLEMMTRLMRPVVIVAYERTPFVFRCGNVRITFDENIASSWAVSGFLDGRCPARPIMTPGQHLLEVKFDEFLPDVVNDQLQLGQLQRCAFSKYDLCRTYAYGGLSWT